ncbi:MAG: hypothetical protein WCC06_00515, partial [Candidatus Aminicenantales bacterium]
TGYAPQARPLVAVCWGLGILLGHFLAHNVQKIFSLLFRLALFLSFLSTGLLLQYPLALYQETTYGSLDRNGELFNILSNLHFHLPNYLPSYLKIEEGNWLPNFIWLGVLLAFVALYIFLPKRRFVLKFNHHLFLVFAGMILFFGGFVLYPRMVLLHPEGLSRLPVKRWDFTAFPESPRCANRENSSFLKTIVITIFISPPGEKSRS